MQHPNNGTRAHSHREHRLHIPWNLTVVVAGLAVVTLGCAVAGVCACRYVRRKMQARHSAWVSGESRTVGEAGWELRKTYSANWLVQAFIQSANGAQ